MRSLASSCDSVVFLVVFGKGELVVLIEFFVIGQQAAKMTFGKIYFFCAETAHQRLLYIAQFIAVVSYDALVGFQPHLFTVDIEELVKVSVCVAASGKAPSCVYRKYAHESGVSHIG